MYPDRDEHTKRPKCADLSAPTTYHPLLKKGTVLQSCAFFCSGTELSQVHNILAKVQFLKKHCFTSKEHRFISKEQRFISKNHRFVSKKTAFYILIKRLVGVLLSHD